MKIFISSVRKGLEEERDNLDGLIRALGHTPVRFEDFSAQSTPSREACLRALDSADACLFLLGPYYGHIFPETGQSATHDEWIAARAAGKARFVFRKLGVTFEDAQHDFTRTVEAYATGVFRDSFHTTPELMIKVTQKIGELESADSPLAYAKLTKQPDLHWALKDIAPSGTFNNDDAILELGILPLEFVGYSARELEQLNASLLDRIRATRVVAGDVALSPTRSEGYVGVRMPTSGPGAWNESQPGGIAELRLYKTGQLSVQATLPRDGHGPILDPDALPQQIADLLRFSGALNIIQVDRIVVASSVSVTASTSIDTFNPRQSRRSAQPMGFGRSDDVLRTEPDESVTLAALGAGASEVATHLAQALIVQARK